MAQEKQPPARGGNGGSVQVQGDGLAIGGPGGRVVGEVRVVRGGDGGGGQVNGDGTAVGGGGGHVAGPGVWLPPARSGYEVHQRALGLPVDPFLAQFGRGGAMPGYEEKLAVVEEAREEYLRSHSKISPESMYDVHSVPCEHINAALETMSEPWRARIFDDQFEFFLPQPSEKRRDTRTSASGRPTLDVPCIAVPSRAKPSRKGFAFLARTGRSKYTGGPMTAQFNVVVERDADGLYVASVSALPGCHTQAATGEGLLPRMREDIALHLEERG